MLFLASTSTAFSQARDSVVCGGERASYIVRSDYPYSSVFDWKEPVGGTIVEEYNDSIVVEWHTDADTGMISVTEIGLGGCEGPLMTYSVDLSNPVVELFDAEACANEVPVEFVAGGNYSSYEWQDGSTSSNYFADSSGYVWVEVTDEYGCTAIDSAYLTVHELPDVNIEVITDYPDRVFITEDSVAFIGGEVNEITLDAGMWSTYEWNTGEITSMIDVQAQDVTSADSDENTGYYYVTVTDENTCSNTDSIAVTVIRRLEIPNAITPNGDGDNDRWVLKGLSLYPNNVVQIYDRWGDLVYQARGYDEAKYWDGTDQNGRKLPMASYYFVIKLGTGEKPIYGSVTIIR